MKLRISEGIKGRTNAYRNPVYLAYILLALPIFWIGYLIASAGVGLIERSLFYIFNSLPDSLTPFFVIVSLFGSLFMIFVVSLIALFRHHYANSLKVLLSGLAAYATAYWIKTFDIRARPVELIDNAIVREDSIGTHGFPSGHAAVATVLALTAYQYLPKKWHRPVTILAALVFVSRLYLGVHFPADLIGGFAIGLLFGSFFNFLFGSRRYNPIAPEVVKERLQLLGYSISSVKLASVDARGSVPYIAKGEGKNYFVKIVSRDNTVADWLFKISRKALYRRLEDEQPHLSPKRQLEHEAYVAMLAHRAGIHTPKIEAVFEVVSGRWAMSQEMIAGSSLDGVEQERLTDEVIISIWQEVKKLHDAKIIHRDLRAANVFLDDKNTPWLIDFGFAEASVESESYYRDTVELLASLSLLIGNQRTIRAALKVMGKKQLRKSLPYLSYASLSGATTTAYKQRKGALKKLQQEAAVATGEKSIKLIKIRRINWRTLLIIVSVGIAFNVLAPQLGSFRESVDTARNANLVLITIGIILSSVTYLLAGLTYRFIAIYPLRYWPTVLIQVASSFASKLAPAGTGTMALNGRYLFKNNHDPVQAGAVTGVNTVLGLVGHVLVVILVSLVSGGSLAELLPDIHISTTIIVIAALSFMTIVLSIRIFPLFRKVFIKSRDKVIAQLSFYKSNLGKLLLGLLTSIAVTITYSLVLYCSAVAMGADLSVLDIVYVFTVGAIAATITPTPGGLGGTEAALIASMTSIGVDNGVAVAITLLYRLLTFWLPIIPGFIAFRHVTVKEMV